MENTYSREELIKKINSIQNSPFLQSKTNIKIKNNLKENLQNLKTMISVVPVVKTATTATSPSKFEGQIVEASLVNKQDSMENELKILTQIQDELESLSSVDSNEQEKTFFTNMNTYLLNFIADHKKKQHDARNSPEIVQNNISKLNQQDSKAKQKLKKMDGILRTLVNTIGKDSPNAINAQGELRDLLKQYPNKIPEVIMNMILAKLRENGIGIIFGVQVMSTLLALLIGLIPIPGIAVISDMIIAGTDSFIDGLVAIGPENVTEFIQNGVSKAVKNAANTFRNDLLPIFKETSVMMGNSLSGVFCCNGSQQKTANENMDKFGDVLIKLITMLNKGPDANPQVEQFINTLKNKVIKTKTINTVDMNALNKLLSSGQDTPSTETKGEEQQDGLQKSQPKLKMEGGKKTKRNLKKKKKRKTRKRKKSKK